VTNPLSARTGSGVQFMSQLTTSSGDQADLLAVFRRTAPYDTWAESTFSSLAKSASRLTFQKGDAIEMDHQNGDAIYLLEQGVLEFQLTVANGRQQVVRYVHPGALIGLTGVYALQMPSEKHEMVAYGECTVWRIPSDSFNDCMQSDNVMLRSVLTVLSTGMRLLLDEIANCTLLSAQARIARCLLLADTDTGFHALFVKTSAMPLRVTQAQLARMLGLSRQSVGTILRAFESDKLVRMGRERIELLSHAGLRDVVNGRSGEPDSLFNSKF
jgi:CRP/FNR family transcriptional regulator, cyclic AMP receptor protein